MKTLMLIFGALLVVLTACASTPKAELAAEARPVGTGSVEVSIENVTSLEGMLYASIYISAEGFPENKELAFDYRSAEATSANMGTVQFNFDSVPAGWFVVAVLQDEDGDQELSMSLMGIPSEDYGFSRNPDSLFGPPDFDEAAIYLEPGENKRLIVNIK
jgi:uncharacterized protein (DUF2141 family)